MLAPTGYVRMPVRPHRLASSLCPASVGNVARFVPGSSLANPNCNFEVQTITETKKSKLESLKDALELEKKEITDKADV